MKKTTIFIKKSWNNDFAAILVACIILIMNSTAVFAQPEESDTRILKKHVAPVKAAAISPDGKILATGGEDKMIYFWDIQSGELTGSIENYFAIRALQFADNDNILAACGPDVKLMDKSGKLIRTFGGYTTDIWSLSYHEASHRLSAGSYSKSIRVWDINSGKTVLTLEGHEKSCLPVSLSPSGELIASGSLDKSVRLWDVKTGNQKNKHELHSENIFAIDFHPSGRYVASASADKTIRLWNVNTGNFFKTYVGHTGAILDICFSADGNHLISCSADHTVILWETATGNKLYCFTGHEDMVNAVLFGPDGKYFVSVSDDRTIRIWPLHRRCFVEFYHQQEIEEAIAASQLFDVRRSGETRQEYLIREKQAKAFLNNLYEEYYNKYVERINRLSLEDINKK